MSYYFKCPSCASDRSFRLLREQRESLLLWVFLMRGWVTLLLFLGTRRKRIQCGDCQYIFRQPPLPRSSVSRFASWIAFIVIVAFFLIFYVAVFPFEWDRIPAIVGMEYFEMFVQEHNRLFSYIFVTMCVAIAVSCSLASVVTNYRFRRDHPQRIEPEEPVQGPSERSLDNQTPDPKPQ